MGKNTHALPARIKIGGATFNVDVRTFDEGTYGQCFFDERTIVIAPMCLPSKKTLRETMRHEVLHASLAMSGVAFAEKFDEESLVRAMENIFFPCWERLEPKLK